MGFTIFYLSLIVLIPLGAAFLKTFTMGWPQFWETVTGARALASYRFEHRRLASCRDDEQRVGAARRLGARAL